MMQHWLIQWLQRPTLERDTNIVVQLGSLLSSDQGGVRKQNQDRALAFECPLSRGAVSGSQVYVLADGMGGMRDGDVCASTAVAAFAVSLLENVDSSIDAALRTAAERANRAVYEFAGGSGGSTLSALVIDRHGKGHAVNCGDSRIYAVDAKQGATRLTIDDNLSERVGGGGRELVRFVGMEEGFDCDLIAVNADQRRLVLTSDGVHFIAPEAFDALARHAPSIRNFVERVTALARWCGSPDNATIIAVDLETRPAPSDTPKGLVLFQDAFSSIYLPANLSVGEPVRPNPEPVAQTIVPAAPAPAGLQSQGAERKKPRKQAGKRGGSTPVQFEISAGLPLNTPESDDDR